MTVASVTPLPGTIFDPVFDSQATFRILLLAMARPGTTGIVTADPGCPLPEYRVVAGILRTLLDHEVTFAVVSSLVSEPNGEDELAAYLAETTGARVSPAASADYVVLLGPPPKGLLSSLKRGRPAYPDESATLIATLPTLAPGAGAEFALAGPGVTPGARLDLAGWSAKDVRELAQVNGEPPLGIDLILVTPGRQVACLPRSTRLSPGHHG